MHVSSTSHESPEPARQTLPADLQIPATNKEFLALKKRLREQAVTDLEREFVLEALQRNGWNVTRAAADVGIQRPNFQMLMRKHGVRGGHGPEHDGAGCDDVSVVVGSESD